MVLHANDNGIQTPKREITKCYIGVTGRAAVEINTVYRDLVNTDVIRLELTMPLGKTNCSNLSRSLEFYTAVLYFAVKVAPNPDPTSFDSKHAILEHGGYLLHLSSHEGDGVFGGKIYVRVSDIDGLYRRCVSIGLNTLNRDSPPALRGGPVY